MTRLSPRLRFICDSLLESGDVWDLCCDHGLVGEFGLSRNQHVHFVDQVPAIITKLRERLGEGPEYLAMDAGEIPASLTGTVVLAGVGGHRLQSILRRLIERERLRATRLVLGPQKNEDRLVAELPTLLEPLGYRLVQTQNFREGSRELPILIWDR